MKREGGTSPVCQAVLGFQTTQEGMAAHELAGVVSLAIYVDLKISSPSEDQSGT